MEKKAISTPIMASVIGIMTISFNDFPPEFELNKLTRIIEEMIVAGTEYLRIPKNKGMRLIPVADSAFISTANECFF